MTNIISPAALKAAAKRIRDLESDRLGQKLSNTTILNAMTQGLGLGQTFAAFTNAASAPAKAVQTAAQDEVDHTPADWDLTIYLVMRVKPNEMPIEDSVFNFDGKITLHGLTPSGWQLDAPDAAHGMQLIALTRSLHGCSKQVADEMVAKTLASFRATFTNTFSDLLKKHHFVDVFGAAVSTELQDHDYLHIDFSIKDHYSSYTRVQRPLWDAALKSDVIHSEAAIILDDYEEIEASVTPELMKVTNVVIKDLPYGMLNEATSSPDASPAGVVTSPVTDDTQPCFSSGYIVLRVSDFENQPDGSLFNPKQQNAMRIALGDDWRITVGWAGNGLQIVSIDRFITASSYADALEEVASTTEYLRQFIETNMADVVKENSVIDHFSGVEALDQDIPKLRVSYHIKHGYEAEAQVSRTLWESAVLDVNKEFSEAEALIVLHETDKIHAQVTPEDIVIDNITQEAATYTARKIKKEAPAPAKCTTGIAILYKVDQREYDGRQSAFTKEEEEAIEEDASDDWKLEIYPVMHGYQMVMLQVEHGKDEDPIATAIKVNGDADAVRHLIEHHAPGFVEDAKLINDGIIIPHRDDDKTLHVNFRYNSTDQICTGNVSEAAWDAFNQHLSVEDSLLMLAGDIEIDADYTAGEITVQDVMSKFELYVG